MPLPDERPRQSVANLIGRFEQQTKRQSLTNIPPRSSTPLAHHFTGESVKDEVKEKREWPPKPKQQKEPEAVEPASASHEPLEPAKPSLPTPDASPKPEAVELPVSTALPGASATEGAQDPPALLSTAPEVSVMEPVAPESTLLRLTDMNKGVPPPPARTASATSKAKAMVAPRPSPATKVARPSASARSPPISYHDSSSAASSTPSATPSRTSNLRSTTAAVHAQSKPRPSSSASVRAPITPSRPKTPAASVARPRTPASVARPKTPSSGLFAPTAASLARARNASDVPPVPIKKPSPRSDVVDRLSKPTASSISKARPTAAVLNPAKPSPARRGVASKRGETPKRGTAIKVKGTTAGAKAQEKSSTEHPAALAANAVVESTTVETEYQAHDDTPEAHREPEEPGEPVEVPVDHHLVDTHNPEDHNGRLEDAVGQEPLVKSEITEEVEKGAETIHVVLDGPEELTQPLIDESEAVLEPAIPSSGVEETHEQPSSPSPTKASGGDDLEDLITMLEAKKPLLHTLPDVVAGEIPDEE